MNPASILIVDDEPGAVQMLAQIVAEFAEVFVATDGEQALRVARESRPDLVLLDAEMPGLSGLDVCALLKADPDLADIPVIFVTARSSTEFEVSSFDHGAADFLTKPAQPALVRARVRTQLRLKQLTDDLRRQAYEDPLTGVPTRRRFDETLRRELALAVRGQAPLALLIIDVDHFKRYNDHYGHPAGDACLKAVARALSHACQRPGDLCARIGGEEFALLLPQSDLDAARTVAARLLESVHALGLPHEAVGPGARVAVSIGASVLHATPSGANARRIDPAPGAEGAEWMGALLTAADQALYHAKREGRGRAFGCHLKADGAAGPWQALAGGGEPAVVPVAVPQAMPA